MRVHKPGPTQESATSLPARGEDAVTTQAVPEGPHVFEFVARRADPACERPLVGLVLQEDPTPGGEEAGRLGEDAAVEVQAVVAAVEGQMWLVRRDCPAHRIDLSGRDVGRVRYDEVEGPVGGEAG